MAAFVCETPAQIPGREPIGPRTKDSISCIPFPGGTIFRRCSLRFQLLGALEFPFEPGYSSAIEDFPAFPGLTRERGFSEAAAGFFEVLGKEVAKVGVRSAARIRRSIGVPRKVEGLECGWLWRCEGGKGLRRK